MKQVPKFAVFLLLFTSASFFALAQPTAGGTNITNTANATFTDANGADRTTQSNTVTTIVQKVFSFNVEPDNGNAPGTTSGTDDSTVVTDNDFTNLSPAATNDLNADAGDTVLFTYTVENLSNVDNVVFGLSTEESDPNNLLSGYTIYVDNDPDVADLADVDLDGIPDNYIVAPTLTLPISDGTAGSGDDFSTVYVQATVSSAATVEGNQASLVDLQVTNTTAIAADADGSDPFTIVTNDNIVFENNNIGRVTINEDPVIGLAKNVSVVNNANGTYTLTYTFTLENFGNVALDNIQVVDDIESIFTTTVAPYAAATFMLASSDGLALNASFNGDTNTNLLDNSTPTNIAANGLDITGAGATKSFTLSFLVTPGAALGPYNNTATATGDSPNDVSDSDTSTTGTDPDPNGDDNPEDDPEDDDPTPITFTQNPSIGVAKQAGTVIDNGNGTFTVPFTIKVENLGDMNLHDVQVTDDLTAEFGTYAALLADVDTAGEYTVSTPVVVDGTTVPAIAANGSFTGSGANTGLLTPSATGVLEQGTDITVSFNLTFYPDPSNAPYLNQASASGDLPANADGTADGDTTDLSNDGTDTDPDGDTLGNESTTDYDANNDGTTDPNEGDVEDTVGDGIGNDTTTDENVPTPITIPTAASIGIAKSAGTVVSNPDGTFTVPFTLTAQNIGNVDLYDVNIVDDLTAEFGTNVALVDLDTKGEYSISTAAAIDGSSTATGFTIATATYNGASNTSLVNLSSTNPLQPNETLVITFSLRFYPDFANADATGTFNNSATATGDLFTNADGAVTAGGDTTDVSDNGTNPDQDGDGLGNEQATDYDANNNGTVTAGEGNVDDASGDGIGNDTTTDENDPTPVTVTQLTSIGIAKQAGTVVSNPDGTFTVPFTLTAQNIGNVDLYDVAIIDDLTAEFGTFNAGVPTTAGNYTLSTAAAIDGSSTATGFTIATATYNGDSNTNLINVSGTNALQPNETLVITFSLRFYPDFANADATGAFNNSATATGDAPDAGGDGDGTVGNGASSTTDVSADGTNPDPDGDGVANEQTTPYDENNDGTIGAGEGVATEPTGDGLGNDTTTDENSPTLVTPTQEPVIGVATTVQSVTNNADGTYEVVYDIAVENLGNVPLSSVQLTQDLDETFSGATTYTVDDVTVQSVSAGSSLTRNESGVGALEFNGSADTNLLDEANGANELLVGGTAVIRVTTTVTPGTLTAGTVTYTTSVDAYGYSPSDEADGSVNKTTPATTASTSDISDNGTNPDPDGDGLANEQATAYDADNSGAISPATEGQVNDDGTIGNGATADENDPTPVTLTERPEVGVAKDANITNSDTDSDAATEGPFEVTFDFYLENLGDVNVTGVELTDSLASFGTYEAISANLGAGEYIVTSVTEVADSGSSVTVNGSFTGAGANTNILGTSTLAVGATAQVRVRIIVFDVGSYTNSATAEGTGPGGTVGTDDSDDSTNPRGTGGDGDTDPSEADENDPTPVVISSSNLDIDKTQRRCTDFDCSAADDGINGLDDAAPVATDLTINSVNTDGTIIENFIEYTIVGDNQGTNDISTAIIYDQIPTGTALVGSTRDDAAVGSPTFNTAGLECSTTATLLVPGDAGFAAAFTTGSVACPADGVVNSAVTWVRLDLGTVTGAANEAMRFVVEVQ